uniref:Uncharacterized protein n=1 Tax=Trypanosoma congolense (strain IL3000) TaxID=1068625 RepID=G0UY76_TRYCI|nr:conserved hypothetical protein [Trypanosoma congolense IL3000]
MGKRRLGGNSRVLRKKKARIAKKGGISDAAAAFIAAATSVKKITRLRLKKASGGKSTVKGSREALDTLRKQRSKLLKRQAAERMVLKEHTRELEARRHRIKRGENAKMERRELGKYIRQLQEEHKKKHQQELAAIEEAILMQKGGVNSNASHHSDEWEDVDSEEDFGEDELHEMFAHLTA